MSTADSPRPAAAIAFIVSGAAILAALLVFITAVISDSSWLYLISYVAMAAALVLLARTELSSSTAKIAALFAALGWVLLLVSGIVTALPGIVYSSAYLVITAASIVLIVLLLRQRLLTPQARTALVALLAVTALYMITASLGLYGPFAALLTILLGVGGVATGYLLYVRR